MDVLQRVIDICSDPYVIFLGIFVCGFFCGSVCSALFTLADYCCQMIVRIKRK